MIGSTPKLDRIDVRILAHLQKNGRVTNVDLADAVGLSASPCLMRVKRLEKAGYITGYGAHIQMQKLGDTLSDLHRSDAVRPPRNGLRPVRSQRPQGRRDRRVPPRQRRLRLPAEIRHPGRPALPGDRLSACWARDRDREVFQLCRHQDRSS